MPLSMKASVQKDKSTGKSAGVQLQHRHFAFIASVLASTKPKAEAGTFEGDLLQWSIIVKVFADELAKSNPNFDLGRFLTAANF